MFARSQHVSSPLVLPMVGSILTTSIIASILILPPSRPTLSLQQLLLRATFDLTIAVCIHVVTVWSIWRLIREYVQPSVGTLTVHIWAVVVWLPLITTLTAEHSLWISCIVPWAFANAITFLNLWSKLPQDDEPAVDRVFLQPPSTPPLWSALLPYCITVATMQVGLASLGTGHPWSGTALISAGVMLFLVHHPFVEGELAMEAHQTLLTPISGDCCHAMRIDLLNGDDRPGPIRVELLLRDTSGKSGSSLLLGSIAIPSSQLPHIALNRPPVAESLRFQMPAKARGRRFDEITVVIKPSSERALGGSKIAIQNFVLVP